MGARSFLPSRCIITLLIAAIGFTQVCTGYARTIVGEPVASAAEPGNSCCGTSQCNGCAANLADDPVEGSCTPVCAGPREAVMPEAVVSSAGVPASACVSQRGRLEFSEKPPVLTAAPAAISSTSRLYFLQRLLN